MIAIPDSGGTNSTTNNVRLLGLAGPAGGAGCCRCCPCCNRPWPSYVPPYVPWWQYQPYYCHHSNITSQQGVIN